MYWSLTKVRWNTPVFLQLYNTGDGSEIRLTAWDVENIRRKSSDKLTTYQLVRQISEPSNRSFPLRLGRFPCDWKGTQVTSHRRRIAKSLNQQLWTTFKMAWKDAEVWNFFTWHNLTIHIYWSFFGNTHQLLTLYVPRKSLQPLTPPPQKNMIGIQVKRTTTMPPFPGLRKGVMNHSWPGQLIPKLKTQLLWRGFHVGTLW